MQRLSHNIVLLGLIIVVDILTTASALVNRTGLLWCHSILLLSVSWRRSVIALSLVVSLVVALTLIRVVVWLLAAICWSLAWGRTICPSSERIWVSTHTAATACSNASGAKLISVPREGEQWQSRYDLREDEEQQKSTNHYHSQKHPTPISVPPAVVAIAVVIGIVAIIVAVAI